MLRDRLQAPREQADFCLLIEQVKEHEHPAALFYPRNASDQAIERPSRYGNLLAGFEGAPGCGNNPAALPGLHVFDKAFGKAGGGLPVADQGTNPIGAQNKSRLVQASLVLYENISGKHGARCIVRPPRMPDVLRYHWAIGGETLASKIGERKAFTVRMGSRDDPAGRFRCVPVY